MEEEREERKGMDRRTFLRRAAVTGAAAAWAAPVVQTITAGPAWATNGTPGGFCGHSTGAVAGQDCNGGCMAACAIACGRDPDCVGDPECTGTASAAADPECQVLCDALCPVSRGETECRECCDPSVCSPSAFECVGGSGASYIGTAAACAGLVS